MNDNEKQIMAEAFEKAFEIIERNLMSQFDAKLDEAFSDTPVSEDRIREIARDETLEAVRDGDITVSIEAWDQLPFFGGGVFFPSWDS